MFIRVIPWFPAWFPVFTHRVHHPLPAPVPVRVRSRAWYGTRIGIGRPSSKWHRHPSPFDLERSSCSPWRNVSTHRKGAKEGVGGNKPRKSFRTIFTDAELAIWLMRTITKLQRGVVQLSAVKLGPARSKDPLRDVERSGPVQLFPPEQTAVEARP